MLLSPSSNNNDDFEYITAESTTTPYCRFFKIPKTYAKIDYTHYPFAKYFFMLINIIKSKAVIDFRKSEYKEITSNRRTKCYIIIEPKNKNKIVISYGFKSISQIGLNNKNITHIMICEDEKNKAFRSLSDYCIYVSRYYLDDKYYLDDI